MIDEDKLRADQSRAMRAKQLLENELLIEAYDKIDEELITAWRSTPARDTDARERIWAAVQANGKHKTYLQSVLSNGALAAAELKALAETADRQK